MVFSKKIGDVSEARKRRLLKRKDKKLKVYLTVCSTLVIFHNYI